MEKKTIIAIVAAIAVIAVAAVAIGIVMGQGPTSKEIKTVDDLVGAKIAVETGTTGDIFVTDAYEKDGKATISRYSSYPDAIMDLKNKKVDAIVMDKAPAQAYVGGFDGIKILDDKLDVETEEYAFIFKLDNVELKAEFDTALLELKADGSIAKIEQYWAGHIDGKAAPFVKETGTGKTIKVATSPDFQPYDYLHDGVFTGIDMDIVRAVCNVLDYKVEFNQYEFESIINAVDSGKVDVGASGFSINEERMEKVLFSDPYTTTEQVVVIRA